MRKHLCLFLAFVCFASPLFAQGVAGSVRSAPKVVTWAPAGNAPFTSKANSDRTMPPVAIWEFFVTLATHKMLRLPASVGCACVEYTLVSAHACSVHELVADAGGHCVGGGVSENTASAVCATGSSDRC